MWRYLLAELRRCSWTGALLIGAGFFLGVAFLALLSTGFSLKGEVSLIELLTLVFSAIAALVIPLLLKHLTSDADARRTLFMGDVEKLLQVYEESVKILLAHRHRSLPVGSLQIAIRRFFSEGELAIDLIDKAIENLGRFALPDSLKEAINDYNALLGEAPFQEQFTITDAFLQTQEDLLHALKIEIRKYQYEILRQ